MLLLDPPPKLNKISVDRRCGLDIKGRDWICGLALNASKAGGVWTEREEEEESLVYLCS